MHEKIQRDKEWADSYFPQIREILKGVFESLIDVQEASIEEDIKQATDYKIVNVANFSIGCRIRKDYDNLFKYGDVTFRLSRPSGSKTEMQKFREGKPDWYFYGWVNSDSKISHWVVLDMDKIRENNILDSPDNIRSNRDGTKFAGFKIHRLSDNGCVRFLSLSMDCYLRQ